MPGIPSRLTGSRMLPVSCEPLGALISNSAMWFMNGLELR